MMLPSNSRWEEFISKLEEQCTHCENDHTLTRAILKDMGYDELEINESIACMEEGGGCCDCEILMNVGE